MSDYQDQVMKCARALDALKLYRDSNSFEQVASIYRVTVNEAKRFVAQGAKIERELAARN